MNLAEFLLITQFFSFHCIIRIILIACSLKDQKQSLLMYTSCLFSMFLNDDIVDIEKADGIFLPTFFVNEFSGLFLHSPIFLNIHEMHK